MTTTEQTSIKPPPATAFGVNEMRLTPRQCMLVLAMFLAWMLIVPRAWKKVEPFHTDVDYRIPYALSKDYWLFQRRLDQVSDRQQIVLLGDSVIWGEYVRPDGTLSHFLNQTAPSKNRFINAGVNGLFPLAMEGLARDYAPSLHHRKLIVHCNMLWMTSPKADLSSPTPENFNHSHLVPQFWPRVPSYSADFSERLSATLDRHVPYYAWSNHLQIAYYDQHSIPQWTLEDDGNQPPNYPNAWKNPLAPLRAGIPTEPSTDPQRGPSSPRHKPWNSDGAQPTHFEWVDLDTSIQWQAFERLIELLHDHENDVLVIVGPFNQHMIADDQIPTYRRMRDQILKWLVDNRISVITPEVLPSNEYADASHPLTQGYARLANQIQGNSDFTRWLGANSHP